MNTSDTIVIVGAGPAGLTAAYELQQAGYTQITVLEADDQVGGISRTVNHSGNRIDIGGHRFFSKSDWVMQWWLNILPLAAEVDVKKVRLNYQGLERNGIPGAVGAVASDEAVMLLRNRLSRIFYNKQFFDYPLRLNWSSLRKLGARKVLLFGLSYMYSKMSPVRPEKSLEDFFINRFGKKLFLQFFKEYTEKVWGVGCHEISAEWGAQRVKSLSILSAVGHALRSMLGLNKAEVQTSLIEHFIYPKYGPGQMWETVAELFVARGGVLLKKSRAQRFDCVDGRIRGVWIQREEGVETYIACQHVISTMPVKDLVQALPVTWAPDVRSIALNLQYRDFITVGLLYSSDEIPEPLQDNWIYIQEPGVQVGRIQIFNNWSPHMVAQADTVWMGLEFFCKETDDLWQMSDEALKELAQSEMHQIGLTSSSRAQDAVVIRVPKAYPGYFGSAYLQFDQLRSALDKIDNLFLVGRNGMHRYNNQDHSMLTAKKAVELIVSGRSDKQEIWDINVDDEYHEEASSTEAKV
jgi:protoporphyrinogen oxidase